MRILILFLFASTVFHSYGQLILTVEDCIETALAENIQLQQAENNLILAKASKVQAMVNYLPSLNAGGGYYIRNGNFFDNSVDRFISETTRSFNVGANARVVLFNGLSNKYNLQSNLKRYEASQSDFNDQKLTVKASVLQSYLNILIDKENLKISSDRIELLQSQLDRSIKRESVGVGNLEDVYNLQSQLANERLNQVTLDNQLQSDFLTLIQTLRLDVKGSYEVEAFDQILADELMQAEDYDVILNEALLFSPNLKSADARFRSSKYDYYNSFSNFIPTVSAFYSYSTSFSSNGAINPSSGTFEPDADFFTQLDYNVQPSIGIEFTIPIFNRFTNKVRYQEAKVGMSNAQLDIEQAKIDITNLMQQIYQDMVAAQSSYAAALENLKALEQSFGYAKKRYETGNTDFYTYLESLNNKNRAEIEMANAKYGIIFRKKILNLYRGS